jgi:carbon monoxide dehydrogenase subunit G
VKIEQTVEVDAPLERVWALVNDVPRIAPCMPGAALTDVVDDKTYNGTIRVKLGPINMNYKGSAVLQDVDEVNHSARISASGKDVRGSGTARAGVDTKLEAISESRTRMVVNADVQLTGKVASFGRGAIQDVSAKLFGQFADCLRQTLEEEGRAPAASGAAGAAAGEGGATDEAAAQAAGATAAAPAPPRVAAPIRAERLAGTAVTGQLKAWWAAVAAFFRKLFGRRAS